MAEEVTDIYEFSEDPATAEQPPILADGEYRATVRGSRLALSGSGNKMIELSYIIPDTQYPADAAGLPAEGTIGKGYIVVTDDPTGRYRYRMACEKHGVVPTKRIDPNAFMGQDVMVRIKSEMYEGVLRHTPFNATRPA